jgi:Zn-dependent M28 family amino/carboxypeptidase
MKLHSILVVLILVTCLGCEPPQSTPESQPKPVDAYQCLTTDVKQIAITRPSGSAANQRIAAYITVELKKLKVVVQRQEFGSGVNIIGIQRGQTGQTIIVGSHYDSVSTTPGADDNASGCAMNLLLARQLASVQLYHTIRYVFFDGEEHGLVGSSYYARNMKEHCDFMVNFDMVGNLHSSYQADPDAVFSELFKKYPWARAISHRQGAGPSDHAPFQQRGVSFVWIFTGGHNRYHGPLDTPNTLNYEGMVKIDQYARDLILSLDKQENKTANEVMIESLSLVPYMP